MSLLINGMEMPTKENTVILISPNGDVWMIGDMPNEDTHLAKAKAVSVSKHGRLGDMDELYAHLNEWYLTNRGGMSSTEAMIVRAMLLGIVDAPTIIPAEDEHTMEEFMYGQERNPNDGSM